MSDVANNTMNGASVAPEAAPEAPEVAKTPVLSPEDAFARKERQIRQQQKALQAEKAKWQEEQKAKDTEYKTKFVRRDQLSEDPLGTLAELGLTPEKLSELLLNAPNQNDPTVRALRAEMKAIKDAQAEQRTWAEQQQTQQYEQAVKQIGSEAKQLIDTDPEFETIKAEGMYESVVELIVETWNTENRLMDVREAALEVENYLVDQGLKFASYGKVQSKLKPKVEEQTPSSLKAPKQSGPTVQLKTLTNQMQTTPSKRSNDAEKRARAIAAMTGKLSG